VGDAEPKKQRVRDLLVVLITKEPTISRVETAVFHKQQQRYGYQAQSRAV
jgi:hypothetical protein